MKITLLRMKDERFPCQPRRMNETYWQGVSAALLCSALAVACGDTGGSGGAGAGSASSCPIDGNIPADFRDTERDAEGVSYSAFGAYPDRMPDWVRAQGVLKLLKEVWAGGQASCTDLPPDLVSKIDASIATLETAIPGEDQQAAAYAANDIHSQMGPLFSYFNPETPIAVVDMDALFLRIGLDAWFGNWTEFDSQLTKLNDDWATLKAQASDKVPTCHRVAGTESVVGDIDDTLQNLATFRATMDVDGSQVESDAGLLEVDILELLFDCAPDGTKPSEGLGSPCGSTADCTSGQVCDLDNAGGLCAPDPANTRTGEPCTTTVDCGTDPRDACNSEVGDGFPGGYCVMEPCDDVKVCSPGATCVALPFETPACLSACTADSDCREGEGYVCQLFPTTPPEGFGPSDHACAFGCTDDSACTPPLTCETASGKCIP
jgi:hypothetical protein